MGRSAEIREQLIRSFRAELAEHVQTMTDGLLALEQGQVTGEERKTTLETIFRAAHSLKGAARAVNVTIIEQLAHSLEGVLDAMQQQSVPPSAEVFTACYRALDAIQGVQAAYEAGETTPPLAAVIALADLETLRQRPRPTSPAEPDRSLAGPETPAETTSSPAPPNVAPGAERSSPGGEETVRVSVAKLDALMAQLGELLVARMRAEQRLDEVRQLQQFVASWQKEWFSVRGIHGRLTHQPAHDDGQATPHNGSPSPRSMPKEFSQLLNYVGASQDWLRETRAHLAALARHYADDALHLSLAIDELEEEIMRMRMLPLSTITAPFGRMVRDLARAAGKEAVLEIEGSDTELDKQVLEQIKDPLIHMLRNALDHGIEPPDEREAAGKPRSGKITLRAGQQGPSVIVQVSDDGAGLDLPALRQALARRSYPDAEALTEAELRELIFSAGVSTSPLITDISGRGIGLSVVRRNVEALQGRVEVEHQRGQGTTFTLTLPLTLTSARGLLVRAAGQTFALPLNTVEYIRAVGQEDVFSLEGQQAIRHNGRPVTLVRLDDVLELPRCPAPAEDEHTPVVVVAAERTVAFAVDELVGEQDMVIKGLGKQLQRVGGIAGATVLGSGEVVLILNAADLIKLALRGKYRSIFEAREPSAAEQAPPRRRILVVDDSITTRTLEKNILEAAGYEVELATDGQEALSLMTSHSLPDLVVSDILMPHMNGFELTERIKRDERMAAVPVILVSSLSSPGDKVRGIEAGADAYIAKGQFDQQNLLETIEQLI